MTSRLRERVRRRLAPTRQLIAELTEAWSVAWRRSLQLRVVISTLALSAAVVLVLAVVGVLGFVSPGFFNTRVLDASAVQSGVQQVLSQDYDLEVQSVTCPDGQQVVPDATFECTAIVDGDQVSVPIKITSADGNYEVGRPA